MSARAQGGRLRLRQQADLQSHETLLARANAQARKLAWAALGRFGRPPAQREWILVLFYHWVLDDQRRRFRQQLEWLRRYGDFMGLDDVVSALQSGAAIGGRYFCVTFDDGFRNCLSNAVPILKELEVPAAFFVPTKYIGLEVDRDWAEIAPFYARSWSQYAGAFEFLNWDECRQIASAGFTIGSHTHSHRRLTSLAIEETEKELADSKRQIEGQLGLPCRHFCCPWGKPGRDFEPSIHPALARKAGYASFLTAEDGYTLRGDSAFNLRRIGCEPEFTPAMLRYSLFPPFRGRSSLRPAGAKAGLA